MQPLKLTDLPAECLADIAYRLESLADKCGPQPPLL